MFGVSYVQMRALVLVGGPIVNISADDAVAGTTRSICSAVESPSAAAELRRRPDHTNAVQLSGDHNGVEPKAARSRYKIGG